MTARAAASRATSTGRRAGAGAGSGSGVGSGSVGDLEALDRQRAFTALLGRPVVDREGDPALWPLVRRHWPVLTEWFTARLGYRLVVSDHAARLYRLPAAGAVVAPPPVRPLPRRAMVLALLAAAAAEETEDVTIVQDLSDRVRVLSARPDVPVAGYDPDRYAERSVFVKAVELLGGLGALHRVGRGDSEQMLSGWARRQDALGGVYEVDRELLLRLVEPSCLVAALHGAATGRDGGPGRSGGSGGSGGSGAFEETELTRRHVVMRRLLELPVCLYADLSDSERNYLNHQRGRLLGWCREMTGWTAEVRAEGVALVPTDLGADGTDLAFPAVRADHFGALMVLDILLATTSPESRSPESRSPESRSGESRSGEAVGSVAVGRRFTDDDVAVAAARVCVDHRRGLTKELRDDPQALADTALGVLVALDLVRPALEGARAGGSRGWWLMPAAARFRNPNVVLTQPRLDEEDGRMPGHGP